MDQRQKTEILEASVAHVGEIRAAIVESLASTERQTVKGKEEFKTLSPSDQVTQAMLLAYGEKRLEELKTLEPSPYFVRCDVALDGETEPRSMYFAKFPFSEREIYSWTAPVATIRFENMGTISYRLPDGEKQSGRLLRRDQYMIVDGKIVFLATESEGAPRELVHQEHFSSQKRGFVLPEIVAQMERAQDQVIRAHHVGPFAISGPAGSGKTTLALHRVAYLTQSPDTAHLYPTESVIVFVQDTGTKEYFSRLLPELGIRNVRITTYAQWASEILGVRDAAYARCYGDTEHERDTCEYAKIKALRSGDLPPYSGRHFAFLESLYARHFDEDLMRTFQKQKQDKVLDHIDITALLLANAEALGGLGVVREHYVEQKNGKLRKKRGWVPLEYSLMVVDEFQNSLPEQLALLNRCMRPTPRSIIYVGDMAQKIHFGTVRGWEEIGETVDDERAVRLHKVYRNTKNILRYIRSLGYDVEIPEGMREGEIVRECRIDETAAEIEYVRALLDRNPEASLGILAKESTSLEPFRAVFGREERVHIFTMEESQGVEFDIVCIVDVRREDWNIGRNGNDGGIREMPRGFVDEKRKILKDLLYVALTRAISELHVTGRDGLSEVIKENDCLKLTKGPILLQ